MRILLLNQDWFKRELTELGHEVLSCGFQEHMDVRISSPLMHIDSILLMLPNSFKPEVIVWLDNSAPILFTGLEESDLPCIFYSVDTHHHAELHGLIGHMFDKTFVAQKDYIDEVGTFGVQAEWLPLWASRWVEPSLEKKWGATFVGNLNARLNPERVTFFDELKNKIDIHITTGQYWEIFPFSEIVVNQTVKGDLNFRVFEAMMCGATVLTERAGNGLTELFKDGEHLVMYEKNNSDEAARIIRDLLADQHRCRQIAANGRNEILKNHLPLQRAKKLDAAVRAVSRTKNSLRFLSAMCNYGGLSISLERSDGSNPTPALVAALKAASAALSEGEIPGSPHVFYLVTSAQRYDRALGSTAGRDLVNAFADANPTISVLQYMKIRNLLNAGRRQDAVALATDLYQDTPEVTFGVAEECLRNMMAAVHGR